MGTTLGRHGINIAQMQLGRKTPGGQAVAVVNVDGAMQDDVLEELRHLPNMIRVASAHL